MTVKELVKYFLKNEKKNSFNIWCNWTRWILSF